MRHVARAVVGLVFLVALTHPAAALADTWRPLEAWRIDDGRLAPWAGPGVTIDASYRGRDIRFTATRVIAAHPLACDGAKYEWLFGGAEDLFEGNLPAPQAAAAQALGLGPGPYATLRVSCRNAGFDFHRAPDGTLQLGLDNVVWTLRPAGPATTPVEIVQELLVTHFTHDMGFSRDSVALKRVYLSTRLQGRIDAYLAKPSSPDEVPDIDGDPFTTTQEYPDRFTLGAVRATARRTVVSVRFAGDHLKRRVDYVLVREGGRWVVDDLVDERGEALTTLLGPSRR